MILSLDENKVYDKKIHFDLNIALKIKERSVCLCVHFYNIFYSLSRGVVYLARS
jgi:hypothetical protein